MGTLANGIAHDFNNLLGGVLTQAEFALAERAAGSRPEEELKTICGAAMRGSEIVRELMIYAGNESESLGLADVSRVIEEMLELIRVSISKQAAVELDLSTELPLIRANPGQISQVVMNLVINASDALDDRAGVIRVATRPLALRPADPGFDSVPDGNYVRLTVSDTGRGMPPETQARAFDPFFSTKARGRGIGLAVVSGIVRKLGGAIHLASEPGSGTTVQILLPCAESESPARNQAATPSAGTLRPIQGASILIVEDEDALRQAASKMLRRTGFSIIEARNGSDALDAIREGGRSIDVLLLDITLPDAPSWQVFQEVMRLRPEVKVIVTSAYGEEAAETALRAPVPYFLRKPYKIGDLTELVRQILA